MALLTLLEETDTYIKLQKTIKEVDIIVEISTEYKPELVPDTGIQILDHFMYTIAWGLNMSIGCTCKTKMYVTHHTIAEDLGQTVGAALKRFFYKKMVEKGCNVCGSAVFGLDEALVRAMVNFEGRRNCFITIADECPGGKCELVEDTQSANMIAFFEGFSQGFPATIHIDLLQGRDPHHSWESAFMALGEALKMAYADNPWKKSCNNPFYCDEGASDPALL